MSQFTQDFCDFAIVTSQQNDQKLLSQTFCTFNYIAVETDSNEKEKKTQLKDLDLKSIKCVRANLEHVATFSRVIPE